MSLRTQILLASLGAMALVFALLNQTAHLWHLLPMELGSLAIYTALFWAASELLFRSLEKITSQTSEVVAGGRAVLAVDAKASDLKKLATNLDELVLRLQAGKKVMHQFLGDASHELRTPLTVISAYLQLLSQPESINNPEFVQKSVDKMSLEANRMQRLIDDLLKLAEIGEGSSLLQTQPVDLAAIINFEVDSLRDIQPMRPVLSSVPGPVLVQGNADLLTQLFANLFANLRRHTAPATEVHVEVVTGASWVAVTCNDAGPGLADEAYFAGIQHFQRYDQGRSRDTGGSGLGMSIMASIVERHGGQIAISRSHLGGLCTRITLPA